MTEEPKQARAESSKRASRASIPFRVKLTVVGSLLALVPLLATGVYLLQISSVNIRKLSLDVQEAKANDLAHMLEAELVSAQNGLDAVGKVLTDIDLEGPTAIELALNLVGSHEALDHVGLYTASGKLLDVIREASTSEVTLPESLEDDLREEAAGENVVTGTAVADGSSARVLITVPLRVGDRVSGFAASLVSLAKVETRARLLVETSPISLFVIDRQKRILVHSDFTKTDPLASAAELEIVQEYDRSSLAGRVSTTGDFLGSAGAPVVTSLIPLPSRSWAIVAEVPHEVAYKSLTDMRRLMIAATIVAAILALVLAFFTARQITRPISQLSNFAKDLAARRFDRRVTVHTRDELAILGDVMSSAAADLQASEERIRTEEAIRGDLGRYLPAELVDKVVRREQDMGLGGRRSEITVLFADVVGFTPLADALPADQTVALLNELFTILTEIVFRHHGTVDKFIGDCVMAVWGAPEPQPDHAERALAAAEDMMRWLEAGNRGWQAKYGATVELAIGINSGEAVVGNIGSKTRMQYTAVGDVVNVAARLEAIARPQQILISEATRRGAGDRFEYRSLGPRQLVGRGEPVHLFEVTV